MVTLLKAYEEFPTVSYTMHISKCEPLGTTVVSNVADGLASVPEHGTVAIVTHSATLST